MKSIYVGNLSFNASEGALRAMFEEFGAVGRVTIATDRETGEQRGFGFVEMNDNEAAKKATPFQRVPVTATTMALSEV